MEANLILKGFFFFEITRTDLPTDQWFFHYEFFHKMLGLRQFFSGQHQEGITRHILVGQWGSQGKKRSNN